MASEEQEKKRKQAPAVAVSSETPQKRLKKQKSKETALASSTVSKTPLGAISDVVPSAVSEANPPAVKSKKDRKRAAADFLSDNEDVKLPGKPQEVATKPKKKARKVNVEQSETVETTAEGAVAPQVKTKNSQKKAKVPKVPAFEVLSKDANKAKQTQWPTKEMKKAVKKVLSNGDFLTADGVNGILEHSSEEDVEITTANAEPSSSMQAEAQRTVNKEMADEVATEDESDDQGAALLAGFDSNGDDSGEDEGLDPANMSDLNLNKLQRKKLRQATRKESKEGTGTVYVGRIPRGFYEAQMRQYFSQFGIITNLRLSRNKTTGASKHFAFIEFESNEVAKIVAQTMDNYLMFGHILKCKYAPSESLHPDTWKGANKRFKIIPYNKIAGRKLEEPKTQDQWEGKIAREQGKREKKLSRAQAMGYHYELPHILGVNAALERKKLGQQEESKATESIAPVEEPTGAIEPPNGVPLDAVALKKTQKSKKKGNAGPATKNADVETLADSLSAETVLPKEANKAKKVGDTSNIIPPTNLATASVETATNIDKPTSKKAKKTKKVAADSNAILPVATVEAQAIAPIATTETKPNPAKAKKAKKQANPIVPKATPSTETLVSTALQRHHSSEREASVPKFAYHPDEIAELTKLNGTADDSTKPKPKPKPKKANRTTPSDTAAAQMQLNAELNDTVEPLPSKNKAKAVESDVEIASTATAGLPTPGDGEKKAGKKVKAEKRKEDVEGTEVKKPQKPRKAKA